MPDPVLRVIGTSATLSPELRRRAPLDLGFDIQFEVLDGLACQRRGVTQPQSYDVYDQWFQSLDLLWTAGSIQPIDTERIVRWRQVQPAGSMAAASRGFGRCPTSVLYVQPGRRLGSWPAASQAPQIAMLPTTYNVDSFAYRRELSTQRELAEAETWSWLLDDRWHGRCALSQDPSSSAVELALAASSAGLMRIADPSDLTVEEIDELFDLLLVRKRSGHFSRFWSSTEDSVRLMSSSAIVVGALWSPAYYALRGMGLDLAYAAPKEGYRGWHSGLSLSTFLEGRTLDMAYAYLNWWLDGVPGALMARQGYYMSVVEPLMDTLTEAEWDYWYGGCGAASDLPAVGVPDAVRQGEKREGGSYLERVDRIAIWSTIMTEHNYLARRWRELVEN
jgi:putative spermidine/putrescine transport system substrate-binding protein